MNPYNCTRPGNLFVGYEELRRELLADLWNGKSFAVLGGRRCGKTSLLLQIETDVKTSEGRARDTVPCFFDMQGFGQITPDGLFQAIYERVVQGLTAPLWTASERGGEYQHFLNLLDKAKATLDQAHGLNWLVLLLVDELDAAVTKLPDDQFFQNLRNFLMISRFNHHFRLVASGVKEMARLISSGSSPLNNLCHVYVRALTHSEVAQLTTIGFPNGLPAAVQGSLLELTGGHPYLVQGVLEKLKKRSTSSEPPLIPERVAAAAAEWMREHKDFRRWFDGFTAAERAVYQLLAEAPGGSLTNIQLRQGLGPELRPEQDEALTVLSYHGLVDDSDSDKPRIGGTMFRDWFLQNSQPQGEVTKKELLSSLLAEATGGSAVEGLRTPNNRNARTIRVNPSEHEEGPAPLVSDHELASERPIGSGSYGTVWLAKTLMGTYRAIKVVYRSNFEEGHPFEREFSGIKKYEPISRMHPGLVQILQVGWNEAGGYFYYVMEAGDDETLGQAIDQKVYSPKNLRGVLQKSGPIPLLECVELSLALVDALKYLHQHKLIHRDIKPANIIFVRGAPKLADIGLVTQMRSNLENATWIGTEGYIPPEGPGAARADVFSLGKVMYEASTGLDRTRFPELPSLPARSANPIGYQALNNIILKACESNPMKRYQTAAELHKALEALQKSLFQPTQNRRSWKFWNRFAG